VVVSGQEARSAAQRQRPVVSYGDQSLQSAFLDRLRLRYELGDDEWYAPETRGEAITAANLFRRGWLIREKAGKRWVYKLAQPELRAL
jgi:hypothetical protein